MTNNEERKGMIRLARAEYITPGKTKNISEAFRWYIEAHPEECAGIPTTITPRETDRPQTLLDEYERPKCRKCGADMFWKGSCRACVGPAKKNQWICKECGFKRFTKKTLEEIIKGLEPKEKRSNGRTRSMHTRKRQRNYNGYRSTGNDRA